MAERVWPSVTAWVAPADLLDEPPLMVKVLPSAPVMLFEVARPAASEELR